QRTRGEAAGQDEAVAALADLRQEVADDVPQAREVLERAELEKLVEQKRRRLVSRRARAGEVAEQPFERGARVGRRLTVAGRRKRRSLRNGRGTALRCRRDGVEVDVLRRAVSDEPAQAQQQ